MTTTTTMTAAESLTELEERVRNGDESVTAAALAKAREAARLEELRGDAWIRARAAEARAVTESEQARVRAEELPRITAAVADVRAAYDAALDAAKALTLSIETMATAVDEVHHAASRAKIPDEARAMWNGPTILPGAEPVLASLANDAMGRVRTTEGRERGVKVFAREWFDSDERAADANAALDARNARVRAKRTAEAKRIADAEAAREAEQTQAEQGRAKVSGIPHTVTDGRNGSTTILPASTDHSNSAIDPTRRNMQIGRTRDGLVTRTS